MVTRYDALALELFEEASELSPVEREEYLDCACRDRSDLRRRVEQLLAADDEAHESSPHEGASRLLGCYPARGDEAFPTPERIGPYRIHGRAGFGGMGIVFEAEQENPKRRVALKVLRPLVQTSEREKRFRMEAQILGRLQHAGIARIYDAGTFEVAGITQPYLAMEFIQGVDLVNYARGEKLDVRARVRLIAEVADAIEHAHARGVVHRDLKPENVLVEADGAPKVLDFGVARVSSSIEGVSTLVTAEGQVVGTLAYMAPEQVKGHTRAVGPSSDVYALGALLFELLAGSPLVETSGLSSTEAVRMIAERDVPRLDRARTGVSRDLEVVLRKALEQEPSRRYESAAAFAADLRRTLDDRPIEARPPSRLYLASKLVRRHRGLALGLLLTMLALVAGTAISTHFAIDAAIERDEARAQSYRSTMIAASTDYGAGQRELVLGHLERVPEGLAGWEVEVLKGRCQEAWRTICELPVKGVVDIAAGHQSPIVAVVELHPDKEEWDRGLRTPQRAWVFQVGSAEPIDQFEVPLAIVKGVAFLPDDSAIVFDGWADHAHGLQAIVSWDRKERAFRERHTFGREKGTALSTDGRYVVADRVPSGYLIARTQGGETVWENDAGRMLLGGILTYASGIPGKQNEGLFFELASGRTIGGWSNDYCLAMADFSHRVYLRRDQNRHEVWDLEGEPRRIASVPGFYGKVAFSPDSTRLLAVHGDQRIRGYDLETGRAIGPLGTHPGSYHQMRVMHDGESVITSEENDPVVRWWPVDLESPHRLIGHRSYVYETAIVEIEGQELLASASWDGWDGVEGSLRLWDPSTGTEVAKLLAPGEWATAVTTIPGSQDLLVAISREPDPLQRLTPEGRLVWSVDELGDGSVTRASHDGLRLAVTSSVGDLFILDSETGRILNERQIDVPWQAGLDYPLAWSEDDRFLYVSEKINGTHSFPFVKYRSEDLEPVAELATFASYPRDLDLSADGRRLLLAFESGEAHVLDTETGESMAVLEHIHPVLCARFHPSEDRIVTGTRSGELVVWSSSRYEELLRLKAHEAYIKDLQWGRDGTTLYSASGDGTVGIWGPQTTMERIQAGEARKRLDRRLEGRAEGLLGAIDSARGARLALEREVGLQQDERDVLLQKWLGKRWSEASKERD